MYKRQAVFWALWRSSRLITEQLLLRPWALRSASARTLVTVGRNFARGTTLGVGYGRCWPLSGIRLVRVGTLLAGLGIGGLAVAFGAQKTIENLFGSISLAVDQPFRVGDADDIYLGASIGICISPDDGSDPAILLRNADTAVNLAKQQGRKTFRFYTESLTTQALERMSLESRLRKAIEAYEAGAA